MSLPFPARRLRPWLAVLVTLACVVPAASAQRPAAQEPPELALQLAGILRETARAPLTSALAAAQAILDAGPEGWALAAERANLDAARRMLDVLHADAGPGAKLRGVAGVAAALHLALLGMDPTAASAGVEPPRHALPSEAARALAARHGVAPLPSADEEALRRLDALPPAARDALARTVDAFAVFEAAAADADPGPLLAARLQLLDAALALSDVGPTLSLLSCFHVSIIGVLFVDVGGCPSACPIGDVALSIDDGGDDVYCNNGGGNGNSAAPFCGATFVAAALIDLGGNDQYVPLDTFGNPRNCGVNGGAYAGGAGFLFDALGNDLYQAGTWGVNGGGVFLGRGFLADVAGDDAYLANQIGVNGGGADGHGALFDVDGTDVYLAQDVAANGGAFVTSTGLLVDGAGDDLYGATRDGVNGGAYGVHAAGFLLDAAGSDRYGSDHTGANGGGYNGPAAGFLLDAIGNDAYEALDHGTNGGGDSGAAGLLIDGSGQDRYAGGSFGTNGGAHQSLPIPGGIPSFGALVDGNGKDTFQALENGANGGALGPATSVLGWEPLAYGHLVNGGAGPDAYDAIGTLFVPSGTNGGAENGGVGLLLDVGTTGDSYTDHGYCGGFCGFDILTVPKTAGFGMGAQVDVP